MIRIMVLWFIAFFCWEQHLFDFSYITLNGILAICIPLLASQRNEQNLLEILLVDMQNLKI